MDVTTPVARVEIERNVIPITGYVGMDCQDLDLAPPPSEAAVPKDKESA